VSPCPQLIFPSKTWFFGIYLNFQQQKSLKDQFLPHPESKSYQINAIKSSCSSRSFQQHKNFQLRLNLIFIEKIIQYSRTFAPQVQISWNQAHAPLLVKSIPKKPRTRSEASQSRGSHNYKTRQNKLLSFIDRCSSWHKGRRQKADQPKPWYSWHWDFRNNIIRDL
jgi:hypothetical protein